MTTATAAKPSSNGAVKKVSVDFAHKAVDIETYPLVFEMVPLKHLFIDTYAEAPEFLSKGVAGSAKLSGYQRMKVTNAEKIAGIKAGRKGYNEGFRWELFTPLIVNRRSVTKWAIIDGGSRFLALNLMDAPGDTLVPVLRYRNTLSYEEEARLFVNLNEQRLGLTAVDTFMAKVEYGDRDAVNVDRLLKTTTGTTIGNAKGHFTCVQAIMDLWSHQRLTAYEGESLKQTMEVLTLSGWIDQPKGKIGAIVAGVGRLVESRTIGEKPISIDRLVEKMETYTVTGIKGNTPAERAYNSAGVRETNSRSRSKGVALILAEVYNKGLKTKNSRIDTVQFMIADSEDDE